MQVSSPITLASARRIGAPPLRFKGWHLMRHARRHDGAPELFLELWKRQRGGFTVMFSRWHDQAWQPDAMTAASLEALMQDLEDYCDTLRTAESSNNAPLGEQLLQVAQRLQDHAEFLHLAGHALNDWDLLRTEDDPVASRMTSNG